MDKELSISNGLWFLLMLPSFNWSSGEKTQAAWLDILTFFTWSEFFFLSNLVSTWNEVINQCRPR